jgi:hypothetical protein
VRWDIEGLGWRRGHRCTIVLNAAAFVCACALGDRGKRRVHVMTHDSSRVVSEENVLSACFARTYTGPPPSAPPVHLYPLVFHTISTMIQQYKLRGEICVGFATLFSYVLLRSLLLRHQPPIPGLPQSCCSSLYTSVFSLQVFFRTLTYLLFLKGWSN